MSHDSLEAAEALVIARCDPKGGCGAEALSFVKEFVATIIFVHFLQLRGLGCFVDNCLMSLDVARRLLDVCSTLLDVARRLLDVCSTFARRLLDVARRCSTLLDVARRCSALLDVCFSTNHHNGSQNFTKWPVKTILGHQTVRRRSWDTFSANCRSSTQTSLKDRCSCSNKGISSCRDSDSALKRVCRDSHSNFWAETRADEKGSCSALQILARLQRREGML